MRNLLRASGVAPLGLALLLSPALGLSVGACGGQSKNQVEEPSGGDDGEGADQSGGGGDDAVLIPEEKFDQINNVFNAKAGVVSRCYDEASAPKGSDSSRKGHVTVGLTIQPDGHASDVRVLETDFTSSKVGDCLVDLVKDWTFPTLPKPLPTSHIYELDRL